MAETLYLDTSVASARVDSRWPDRMRITQHFWTTKLPGFRAYISEVVMTEVLATPDQTRRHEILAGLSGLEELAVVREVEALAIAFLSHNLVPARKVEDALHLALAVHYGVDYLVSWNFDHMVAAKTKRKLPVLAAEQGYSQLPLIVSPLEF